MDKYDRLGGLCESNKRTTERKRHRRRLLTQLPCTCFEARSVPQRNVGEKSPSRPVNCRLNKSLEERSQTAKQIDKLRNLPASLTLQLHGGRNEHRYVKRTLIVRNQFFTNLNINNQAVISHLVFRMGLVLSPIDKAFDLTG